MQVAVGPYGSSVRGVRHRERLDVSSRGCRASRRRGARLARAAVRGRKWVRRRSRAAGLVCRRRRCAHRRCARIRTRRRSSVAATVPSDHDSGRGRRRFRIDLDARFSRRCRNTLPPMMLGYYAAVRRVLVRTTTSTPDALLAPARRAGAMLMGAGRRMAASSGCCLAATAALEMTDANLAPVVEHVRQQQRGNDEVAPMITPRLLRAMMRHAAPSGSRWPRRSRQRSADRARRATRAAGDGAGTSPAASAWC